MVDPRPFWGALFSLLLFVGLAAGSCKLYDRWSYATHYDDAYAPAKEHTVYSRHPEGLKAAREVTLEYLRPLFVANAPVEKVFQSCQSRWCFRPGWNQLAAMKKWAARPVLFESDMCKFFGADIKHPDTVEIIYARAGKDMCKVVNFSEVRAKQKEANALAAVKAGGVFVVGLVALVFWRSRRKEHYAMDVLSSNLTRPITRP